MQEKTWEQHEFIFLQSNLWNLPASLPRAAMWIRRPSYCAGLDEVACGKGDLAYDIIGVLTDINDTEGFT